jgi:hypothetical protein
MTMRRLLALSLALIVALFAAGVPPAPLQAQSPEHCFAQTGCCIAGRVREFWERNGGLPVFGYPTTAQADELVGGQMRPVQWFERARFEMHPEMAPGGRVLLGLLGSSLRQRTSDKIANAMSAAPMSLAAMRP